MKYELWHSETDRTYMLLFEGDTGSDRSKEPDAKVVWTVEADTYEEALQKRNDYLGWGEYKSGGLLYDYPPRMRSMPLLARRSRTEAVSDGMPSALEMNPMQFSLYREQIPCWPQAGRHILAQYDDASVIVYQAYRPGIGRWAIEHGQLGGPEFGYSRMSWIKPNFLWMMFRSGWGVKENQEITLGLRIRRAFFDELLAQAVESSFSPNRFADDVEWQRALAGSAVRLQWDPDHQPSGAKLERRALQLGLRGAALQAFGRTELVEVIDLSEFVAKQRAVLASEGVDALVTPTERVYTPASKEVRIALGLDDHSA